MLLAASLLALAAQASADPIVTIERLELKKAEGRWVTILQPDRRFDTAREDPRVSVFNNGRVFPGSYVNFRLTVLGLDPRNNEPWVLSCKTDLSDPLAVKEGSFIGVKFVLDPDRLTEVRELRLAVDDVTKTLQAQELSRTPVQR